jgi:hypothetical protein
MMIISKTDLNNFVVWFRPWLVASIIPRTLASCGSYLWHGNNGVCAEHGQKVQNWCMDAEFHMHGCNQHELDRLLALNLTS